ncbi:MAG TPA: hypothetical protein V6D29_17670 [Leptolyngbyaceae cyanobacterium]
MRLRVVAHTVLKQQPKQSAELAESEKYGAKVGDEFVVARYEETEGQHLKLVLAEPLSENRTIWYAFQPHVELIPDLEESESESFETPVEEPAETVQPVAAASGLSEAEANMTSNIGCGSSLAVLGVLLLIVPALQFLNPMDKLPGRLNVWGWGALGIGVVSASFGTWLGVDALVAGRQAKRDRIQSAFFNLIEASNGEITVLQFARAANLSGEQAQKYLDTRAKEFGADFQVGPEGGIYYRFK